ncbi:MAG: MBL fold metallo-hydrolase [Gammaproteobacteria bacterium]|nr:MBL fold metallo-hydrolase [Gammaproteobacteria bacterium]
MTEEVRGFFDEATNTVSYVLIDPATSRCAIIDPVWDYDPKSGRTDIAQAKQIEAFVRDRGLTVELILETHAHADHLSASQYLKGVFSAPVAIGEHIVEVQKIFKEVFYFGDDFPADGSQFDRLIADGERFNVGKLELRAMHTPGHTPACMTYVCGASAFVGDTLFMPDYGTARADFPGGDAATLYRSIRKVFELPEDTVLYLCHDYLPDGRSEYMWDTTVGDERRSNIHVQDGVSEAEYVKMREARDATLDMPTLILPSVQVNIRAGQLPPAEGNGVSLESSGRAATKEEP